MKITFWGAAGEVTGSQHLVEAGDYRILLDCGLFQGPRAASRAKNERFHCKPEALDAVVLSHAHIDHCGNLPGLYKSGFRGPVYCTPATADVAAVMLDDSCHIQQEDARYLQRKLEPGHPSVEPLYGEEHVDGIVKSFESIRFGRTEEILPGVTLKFYEAGHILGSAIVELTVPDGDETKRIVFTGDLGRRDLPLLKNPETVGACDVLITESTYGDRVHPPAEDLKKELVRVLKEAVAVEGRVIIPAFSLGRTQTIVYFLNQMRNEGILPQIPVFVDSPLSLKLTKTYRRHAAGMDDDVQNELSRDGDVFGFPGLTFIQTPNESMSLNDRKGAMVIIAAGGMCESGRVVHHLKHAIGHPQNTVLLMGFQAEHTLGRQIQDRRPTVKIFDRRIPLKAHVETLSGLSAHADVHDFQWWFGALERAGGCRQSFIVHGEDSGAKGVSRLLEFASGELPVIAQFGHTYDV